MDLEPIFGHERIPSTQIYTYTGKIKLVKPNGGSWRFSHSGMGLTSSRIFPV